MHYDCLIVDDEEALGQNACEYFNLYEVNTLWVPTAADCLTFFDSNTTDLLLLDINLGEDSGFALCKQLRERFEMPIIFISGRTSDDDILMGLEFGGDEYITKPFSLSVLLAKSKALLKRYRAEASTRNPLPQEETLAFGQFLLDLTQQRLLNGDTEIKTKALEFKLLAYLASNSNRVIPKNELFQRVWENAITSDATLNTHIYQLREKIEDDPNNPTYIKNIWGVGYRFEMPDQ